MISNVRCTKDNTSFSAMDLQSHEGPFPRDEAAIAAGESRTSARPPHLHLAISLWIAPHCTCTSSPATAMHIPFTPTAEHPWTFQPTGPSAPPVLSAGGGHISYKTLPGTDWWRTTDAWRSSGAAYVLPIGQELEAHSGEELEAGCSLEGDWDPRFEVSWTLHYRNLADSLASSCKGISFPQVP